jgi:type II secretory pathway component PulM
MKEWWLNLGFREKQTVTIGGIIVLAFLIYAVIWLPISNYNTNLREKITQDQKLLTWMQEANQRIQAADKILHPGSTIRNSAAILSLLQKEINQSSLKDYLTQMSQAENNAVQMTFQKVNFDSLVEWLITLWKKQGVTVIQITTTPEGMTGSINATLIVK